MRLYVKWQGKEIDGQLPNNKVELRSALDGQVNLFVVICGNAIFFLSAKTIYKAVFNPPKLSISAHRKVKEGEKIEWHGLCTTSYGGIRRLQYLR
ncbi:hypothetical protein PMAYCL1PPCAC_09400 [Pristionchus mayeri]|uniref:Uncharacterized protein n=1 Tax=Pristionchus mayeri TaxID=1317129 RepID=A0AAN4ZKB1_9BILA|nr:hypothetical protein PMAYCL1PPCAC_09400 [Pristionchus mayeri]